MKDHNNGSEKDAIDNPANKQEKRRKAVKNILLAGGGAMTASQLGNAKWAKPVMDSVVLPAHAETTDEVASDPGFSTVDPAVYLTYECSAEQYGTVIVDIGGFLNVQTAGIKVKLVLSWSCSTCGGSTPSQTSPRVIEVVTAADGSYSSTDNDIGYRIDEVTVVASLPDFPASGTAGDTIEPDVDSQSYGYYCADLDED